MRKLRKSLQKVNEQVKAEDKLCNRTSVALNYLLTYRDLSFILAALQHLGEIIDLVVGKYSQTLYWDLTLLTCCIVIP